LSRSPACSHDCDTLLASAQQVCHWLQEAGTSGGLKVSSSPPQVVPQEATACPQVGGTPTQQASSKSLACLPGAPVRPGACLCGCVMQQSSAALHHSSNHQLHCTTAAIISCIAPHLTLHAYRVTRVSLPPCGERSKIRSRSTTGRWRQYRSSTGGTLHLCQRPRYCPTPI